MTFDFLVIAGGKPPSLSYLRKLLHFTKKVVTVDRGGLMARRLQIKPYLHVGDGDSLSFRAASALKPRAKIFLPQEKSISDLEYALNQLPAYKSKLVVGAHIDFEGRTDHSFINLVLLSQKTKTFFADENGWVTSLHSSLNFKIKEGRTFSIAPMSHTSKITVSGAKFILKNSRIKNMTQGLSNLSLGKKITVRGNKALLFVNFPLFDSHIDDSDLRS